MPQTSDSDAYNFFMEGAKRYPLLTPAQEIELGHSVQVWLATQAKAEEEKRELTPAERRTAKRGKRAYNKFFNSNLRLLGTLANKWIHAATHLSKEDLVQEGAIGLSRAIIKFDPTMGYKFSTYAYWWIRQAMSRALDNHDRIVRLPGACLTALKKVRNWQPGFCAEHGRMPTLEECAEHAEVTVQNLKVYFQHLEVPVSLNASAKSTGEKNEGSDTLQFVVCPHATPDDLLMEAAKTEHLGAALDCLTSEQRHVIDSLFGLSNNQPMSISALCQQDKIPKTKIVSIRDTAINRMKAYASRHGIRP